MTKLILRDLEEKDIPQVVAILRKVHSISRYKEIEFDDAVVASIAHFALASKTNYFAKVVVNDADKVLGGLHGYLVHFIFSQKLCVQDSVVFIDPEERCGKVMNLLYEEFVAWGKQNGAVMLNLGTSSGINEELTGKLYQRLGLTKAGELYTRSL